MGIPPDLFRRLSRLNRRLLRENLTSGEKAPAPESGWPSPAGGAEAAVLEELIPGEQREAFGGRFYLIRRRADEFRSPRAGSACEDGEGGGGDLLVRYRRVFSGAGLALSPDQVHEDLRPLALAEPAAVTYLDIETCGLAGEPLFLVGLLRYDDNMLLVEQFFARDYSEEGPLLAAVWAELARTACLVTYNGKTFDMPFVGARSLACGLFDCPAVPEHVDLLFEARRRWKRLLPNCRLQTVERFICGRRRAGDIPGGDIPAAYHEFVRASQADDPARQTRSLRRLQTILHHNALDLLTMADLSTRILSGSA
jgi:uncharacterized protein YprB with RNaseH-like and TPR domain